MVIPWRLKRTIGPLLSQRVPLASAKAQPRGDLLATNESYTFVSGMFFQWIMSSSIWSMGLCIHAIRNFPKFYPLAMLGGFLWSTGNSFSSSYPL